MPTDEKFIELLRKIKENCIRQKPENGCPNCPFAIKTHCQVDKLVDELFKTSPYEWNMEEIERIIRL